MIEVTTPRLLLRPLREDDRAEFLRVHRESWDGHLAPRSPAPPCRADGRPDFDAMFDQSLLRTRDALERATGVRLLAFSRAGPDTAARRLIGGFNLNNVVRGVFRNADAGWWVARDSLRQGYAKEGVHAIVRLALLPQHATPAEAVTSGFAPADGLTTGLGLHRVQCGIVPDNIASLAVAARVGFRQEGVAQRYLKINGRWQDHVILAITAEEFAP